MLPPHVWAAARHKAECCRIAHFLVGDRGLEVERLFAHEAVEDGRLIVTPLRRPREGWAAAARTAAAAGDDQLLDPETPTTFDRTDWQW